MTAVSQRAGEEETLKEILIRLHLEETRRHRERISRELSRDP